MLSSDLGTCPAFPVFFQAISWASDSDVVFLLSIEASSIMIH